MEDLKAAIPLPSPKRWLKRHRIDAVASQVHLISGRWHPGTTAIARQTGAVSAAK